MIMHVTAYNLLTFEQASIQLTNAYGASISKIDTGLLKILESNAAFR